MLKCNYLTFAEIESMTVLVQECCGIVSIADIVRGLLVSQRENHMIAPGLHIRCRSVERKRCDFCAVLNFPFGCNALLGAPMPTMNTPTATAVSDLPIAISSHRDDKSALARIAWSERANRKLLPVGRGSCRIKCGSMKAVAIKKGQTREQAPAFKEMGTLRCEGCGEEFTVFHEPTYVDKAVAERQAHWLEKVLAEEHERELKHADRIQLPD